MTQNANYHIIQQVSLLKFCLHYFPPIRNTYMRNVYFYSLTSLSRVLREKLTRSQLVKKFPAFYGTRSFVTSSKSSATCPYPEPDQSSPYLPIPLPEDPS